MNENEIFQNLKYDLSIVVPVLITSNNKMEKYLQRCIDSLKTQIDLEKYSDRFEVIIIDDASYDQTVVDTIDFGQLNYKIIKNTTNLNIGGSRNVGLENALGKYIWYFDADDYFSNTAIQRFFINYEKIKHLDIQLFFMAFSSISTVIGADGKKTEQTTVNDMKLADYAQSPVSSCCKIIRRDKAVRHPENCYMEDVVYNFKQLDAIDSPQNICGLVDGVYWTYDLRRETNFTTTSRWLQANKLTIEQHITNEILTKNNLKRTAISDVFRVVADLYDLIPTLTHNNIKQAAGRRLINITDKIKCCNYTH